MGTFYVVLQMLCRGQNCKFCHIESCGKKNVTNLIKQQTTSFFLHMGSVSPHQKKNALLQKQKAQK